MEPSPQPPPTAEELELLFQLELFKDLPKKLRDVLVRFRRYTPGIAGTIFIRQGEYTEDFHYVLAGSVSAFRANADGKVELLESLGPHEWFGEVSALSNQPSLATLKADVPCTLLTIDGSTFRVLYKDVTNAKFRERIDKHYRERALIAHMRTIPLFRALSDSDLARIRPHVHFETFAKGKVIAEQDAPVSRVYMVRSGAVGCTRRLRDGKQKIVGYHMNNSSFGERALEKELATWPGTYTALAPTDVLSIEKDAFGLTFGSGSAALNALQQAALELLRADQGQAAAVRGVEDAELSRIAGDDRIEQMVRRQSVKGGEALVIDLQRCVRCNMCVETCVAVHEDRVPRLSKKGSRVSAELNLATSCYNCEIPECMMACGYGAIRRDVEGVIRFVYDNCVGCASCVSACPYGVIRYTPPPGAAPVVPKESFLEQIPWVGQFFRKAAGAAASEAESKSAPVLSARGEKVNGKSIKCDLCAGLPFEGCVYNCPTAAISRQNPAALFESESSRARVVDGAIHDAVHGGPRG
ncbi:MAG: cyclic nucleotide-binding domain-containing protein [Planctomycetes bacterium]|nr:cyclic nucleotide-binding domain-containing protein [Planctomycetota bacterium]